MNPKATLCGAFAACCIASFIVGRISSGPGPVSPPDLSTGDAKTHAGLQPHPSSQHGIRQRGLRAREQSGTGNKSGESSDARRTLSASPETSIRRMKSIIHNRNRLDRTADWFEFVTTLNPAEFQDLATLFVTDYKDGVYYDDYHMLLDAWARHDPLTALKHAEESNDMNTGGEIVLAAWGATDPDSAMSWIESNRDKGDINYRIADVIIGIASRDLKRANELAMQMPESAGRNQAIVVLTYYHLRAGHETALKWVQSMKDEEMRQYALAQIATTLAAIDPEAKADLSPHLESCRGRKVLDQAYFDRVIDYMSQRQ